MWAWQPRSRNCSCAISECSDGAVGLGAARGALRGRRILILEAAVLRQQLAVLRRKGTRRPCFRPLERLFWILLSRWWADSRRGLVIIQPTTVRRWRRQGWVPDLGIWSRGRWRGGR